VLAGLLIVTGCSGQTGPASIPGQNAGHARAGVALTPPQLASVRRAIGRKSRVVPAAAKDRLLYVADSGANAVFIYTYPQLSGAGEISGFGSVNGVCTDRRGYGWVLDTSDVVAWEFSHGGSEPINYVQPGDASGNPGIGYGCSINPKNGDLAVAGIGEGFTVFRNGQQTRATYWDYSFFGFNYAGYDGTGNLYVDGQSQPRTSRSFWTNCRPARQPLITSRLPAAHSRVPAASNGTARISTSATALTARSIKPTAFRY
jgi:hypothetical protein